MNHQLQEAKKIAAAGMLERLTSAGTEGAKVIVFTGNSVNSGNKNGLGSDLELSDMRIEPMTMKHSKVMQQFFKNLEVQVQIQSIFKMLFNFSCWEAPPSAKYFGTNVSMRSQYSSKLKA